MGEKTVILLSILLLLVLSCSSLSYAQSATPVEVVNIFNRCYGEPCMDDAAEITSAHFRDGQPESVWVGETWMEMKGMKYKTLESSVIDSRPSGRGLSGENQDRGRRGVLPGPGKWGMGY